jgi:glycosyltransferase involved in cell wall biosynthesis
VVATPVGGVPSSIDDGVDGLLVPPANPEALAAAILRIAREPALRSRLIEAGRARCRQVTIEAFARQIAEEAVMACGERREYAAPALGKSG